MFQHIKRRFYSIFKKGLKDERGAVAIIFAMLFVVAFGASGTIIQKTKADRLSQRLQDIADEASRIAMKTYAKTDDKKKAKQAALDFIEKQRGIYNAEGDGMLYFGNSPIQIKDIEVIPGERAKTRVELYADYPGFLLLDLSKTYYLESTGVSTTADVNTEIAVVLDISESMTKQARMYRAKMALIEFAGRTFKTLKSKNNKVAFSLVPYAGSVHFGNEYWHFGGIWRNPNSPITRKNWNGCFDYWSPASRGWRDDGSILTSPLKRMARVNTDVRYPWCPDAHNKILPFAQTARQFSIALSDLGYGDGTSTDTGMAWGFRLLSEHWRSRFRGAGSGTFPLKYTDKNQKHIILLTDGQINVYHSDYSNQQAVRNFRNTCARIGQRGIIVHVIGYDTDPRAREPLQRCANIEYGANSGSQFYEATSSTIDTVFDEILAQVTPIRTAQ